jgi:hypothetical protein
MKRGMREYEINHGGHKERAKGTKKSAEIRGIIIFNFQFLSRAVRVFHAGCTGTKQSLT